ncbi:MAG: hypothetical protein ABIP85_24340 [Chthoniobacteraceae bacterium]
MHGVDGSQRNATNLFHVVAGFASAAFQRDLAEQGDVAEVAADVVVLVAGDAVAELFEFVSAVSPQVKRGGADAPSTINVRSNRCRSCACFVCSRDSTLVSS